MPSRKHPVGGLRVAVIGEPTGWHVGRLLAALAARGHQVAVVRWTDLAAEVAAAPFPAGATAGGTAVERFLPPFLEMADLVVVRGMPGGGLEEVVFRMDLLGRLAARGTPVFNSPKGLEIAIDKYLSLARIAAVGLPVPRTIVAQSSAAIEAAWQSLGGDCVAKPLFGSGAVGLSGSPIRSRSRRLLRTSAAAHPAGRRRLSPGISSARRLGCEDLGGGERRVLDPQVRGPGGVADQRVARWTAGGL